MSKGRVLVAMSGGIDSSIAALLLHKENYEVLGITMKTWDYAASGGSKKETGCCSLDSINDARALAVQFGFPHYVLDLRQEFGDSIISNFVSEYLAGRTPNPCVLCNTFIKWDVLLRRADQLNCEFIATGHYARIRNENARLPNGQGRNILSKAHDDSKDQTYFLWGLSQQSLKRTIFPLSEYTKKEVRALARKYGLSELADKNESYEICFIPDNDYRSFLKRKVNGLSEKIDKGNFLLSDGTIVGKHEGYPFYTIGQRKGLKVSVGEPLYVTKIEPQTNTVYLGKYSETKQQKMLLEKMNLIKYSSLPKNFQAVTKIRYRDSGMMSTINQIGNHRAEVFFHKKVFAIAPGQSAVFYEGDDVAGGGIINQ